MSLEKYLSRNSEELFSFLITDVMNNPVDGERLLEELSKTKHYRDNYELRITVETTKNILIGMKGIPTKLIPLASNLIQTCQALKLPQLEATNLNLLGVAYSQAGLYEKAVECYHRASKTEKNHGLFSISSIAYNNIAMINIIFGLHEKSVHYFDLAVQTLKSGGEEFIGACQNLSLEAAHKIAEEIRSGIYSLNIPHNLSFYKRISVSIGVAISFHPLPEQKSDIMRAADLCLYEAKEGGRNQIVIKTFHKES